MIVLNETADAARALGVSEKRLRRLVEREIVQPTARTPRGTMLFDRETIERARQRLRQESLQ